jgi:hypothetical protein
LVAWRQPFDLYHGVYDDEAYEQSKYTAWPCLKCILIATWQVQPEQYTADAAAGAAAGAAARH